MLNLLSFEYLIKLFWEKSKIKIFFKKKININKKFSFKNILKILAVLLFLISFI